MRRVTSIKNKIESHKSSHVPSEPQTPPMEVKIDDKIEEKIEMKDEPNHDVEHVKMELEEADKQVNIDEILKQENDENGKCINLDEEAKPKKEKKKYELDDTILKDIILSSDTHLRLLSNINGYFVDLRKFFRGYPSQKGIRVSAGKFMLACEHLKKDIGHLKLPGVNLDK